LAAFDTSWIVYTLRFQKRESALAAFERFNATVRKTIPADRLLVLDVMQGWPPLCDFLGVSIPDSPFAHVNSRDAFPSLLRRMHERERAGLGFE